MTHKTQWELFNLSHEEKLQYFEKLGERLLEHKYRYYVLNSSIISDFEYDYVERVYDDLAKELGLEPVCANMVGFNLQAEPARLAASRVDSGTDYHSTWLKEIGAQ